MPTKKPARSPAKRGDARKRSTEAKAAHRPLIDRIMPRHAPFYIGLALGVMSTGARLGFLVSPAVVGGLASATSLRLALAVAVGTAGLLAFGLDEGLGGGARGAQA